MGVTCSVGTDGGNNSDEYMHPGRVVCVGCDLSTCCVSVLACLEH